MNVAILGCGGQGRRHAQAWTAAGHTVTALFDPDRQAMESLRVACRLPDETQLCQIVEAVLWGEPFCRIISVASIDSAHYDQVFLALHEGRSVFCEKPLCVTPSELRSLSRLWTDADSPCPLVCNFPLRVMPVLLQLKQKIAAGVFGDIYAVEGDYWYGRLSKITEGWRKDEPYYSVMVSGGIHLVDLMCWLTGQYPEFVSGVGNDLCTRGTAFQHQDYQAATFQFASGMIGRISANFGCVRSHQTRFALWGTKQSFLLDDDGSRLYRTRKKGLHLQPRIPERWLPTLIPEYAPRLSAGEDMTAVTKHDFRVLECCLVADQAAQESTTTALLYTA